MVCADCHDAEEPEDADAGKLQIGIDFDTHGCAVRGRSGGYYPSGCHFQHRCMRKNHASNGIGCISLAGYDEFDNSVFGLDSYVRLSRDQFHIHQVIAQCLNIDLGPVGVWVVGQNLDDLSNSGECRLPRFSGSVCAMMGMLRGGREPPVRLPDMS